MNSAQVDQWNIQADMYVALNMKAAAKKLKRKQKPVHWGTYQSIRNSLSRNRIESMMKNMIEKKFPEESRKNKSIKKMRFVREGEPLPERDYIWDMYNQDNIQQGILYKTPQRIGEFYKEISSNKQRRK